MPISAFNIFSINNLNKIEQLIWDFFQQGVKNKKSAFHYPTIATGNERRFNLRTVILREVVRESHIIIFHTDIRSKKIEELKSNNRLHLHVYDKKNKIQIQAEGKAEIFNKVKLNELTWNSLSNNTKSAYLIKETPGIKIKSEKDFNYLDEKKGFRNFAIVKVGIKKITFLNLNYDGNKKAFFEYGKNNIKYFWIVP
ncbi:MAG: hypothetical protein CBC53_005860 [Alphaproteobacteria bacterium TMED93]|nr:MAG: hypothetical protein CBC53_005860 [Alphaproteobacteria bacterium TMED93]